MRVGRIEARQIRKQRPRCLLGMKRRFTLFGLCALLGLVACFTFLGGNTHRAPQATKSDIVVAEDGTVINLRNNFTIVGPKSTTNASTSVGKN
jgi:hypothetical protein